MELVDVLLVILSALAARAVWWLVGGVLQGLSAPGAAAHGPRRPAGAPPSAGVQMAKDPVCGTYVVPDHAVSALDGGTRVFFCSDGCRDQFAARRVRTA